DRFGAGDTKAVDELALDSTIGQIAGHLLAAAMDYNHAVPAPPRFHDLRQQALAGDRVVEQRAPEFHQQLHNSDSVSANPSVRLRLCTACPAAPFTRLSIALTTTARPVRGSKLTPISQKLVRATACRSGTAPGLYRRMNGSPA